MMIRKKINEWQDRMDDGLRRMCGRLTPGKQLAVTLTMLLGFSALSIYFTVSGIYRRTVADRAYRTNETASAGG